MASARGNEAPKYGERVIPTDVNEQIDLHHRPHTLCVPKNRAKPCKENGFGASNPWTKEHNEKKGKRKNDEDWNMHKHTLREPSTDCGYLINHACYMRVAMNGQLDMVERILLDFWKIPKPRLIMSIIGGAKYFKLTDRLETNFINSIINVALSSDAWVFTNGYNVGIVQLVGKAIHKSKLTNPQKKIIAIALCKWGCIKNRANLIETNDQTNQQNSDDVQDSTIRQHGERDLELNHSHYLMLDDGTVRNYDMGNYRTRLSKQISKSQGQNAFSVPVVTIVVEGGRDTITNMYYDLKDNVPIVIIDGSGRVADFFKRWLLYTKEFDDDANNPEWEVPYEITELDDIRSGQVSTVLPYHSRQPGNEVDLPPRLRTKFNKYKEQLIKELEAILTLDDTETRNNKSTASKNGDLDKRAEKAKGILNQVMYCLQPAVRSSITVFNLNSESDLSETIVRSICKSRKKRLTLLEKQRANNLETEKQTETSSYTPEMIAEQLSSQKTTSKKNKSVQRMQLLELAMNWNCIDVAKEMILESSLDNILDKRKVFTDALKNNLPTFVDEFIKLGIDPSEVFMETEVLTQGHLADCSNGHAGRYRLFINELYSDDAVNASTTHLHTYIESNAHDDKPRIVGTHTLNDVVSSLIGDYIQDLYFNTQQQEDEYKSLWEGTKQSRRISPLEIATSSTATQYHQRNGGQLQRDCIMRDLFLWAVFMNRIEMAKIILAHMKYRICAALIATKILKTYYGVAEFGDIKDSYKTSADYFEQYAIECIKLCYKNNPEQACEIVLQRISLFGDVTCLQVAANAQDKAFIAMPCCVQALNNVWYDKIRPEQSRYRDELTLFLGFISFGLLAPLAINFRRNEDDLHEPRLEPYGINYSDPYPLEYPRKTNNTQVNRYFYQIKNFHAVLRTKFCYHCVQYCFLLLLFSYVLLFAFEPPLNGIPSIDWTEILTIILVSCMFIEEFRCFLNQDSLSLRGKFSDYFSQLFKQMTLLAFVLFYIGLVLRFQYADSLDNFIAARVVMAYDLEIWWLLSLQFIIVVPFLGPHLVAIGKMLKDLFFFMCIIAVVMIGYGTASRSMAYYPYQTNSSNYDTSFNGRSIFRQIVYPVYYLLYNDYNNETGYLDASPDEGWSMGTHVLLAIHLIFVNILLTNLLIAMFSKRFDQVYDDIKIIWHYQQYVFTREYYDRSPFFPPINLLFDIYHLCYMGYCWIRRCLKQATAYQAKSFKIIPTQKATESVWCAFEGASTYEYAHAEVKSSRGDSSKTFVGQELRKFDSTADGDDSIADTNNPMNGLKQVQDDIVKMNGSMEDVKKQLNDVIRKIEALGSRLPTTP